MGEVAKVEQFMLPSFSFAVTFVGADKLLEDYDRILADVSENGTTLFRIGFHSPTGKIVKGKKYDTAKTDSVCWAKGIRQNRLEIVFGEEDPAADLNYADTVETLELPF
jgi:hypothetical protein